MFRVQLDANGSHCRVDADMFAASLVVCVSCVDDEVGSRMTVHTVKFDIDGGLDSFSTFAVLNFLSAATFHILSEYN